MVLLEKRRAVAQPSWAPRRDPTFKWNWLAGLSDFSFHNMQPVKGIQPSEQDERREREGSWDVFKSAIIKTSHDV